MDRRSLVVTRAMAAVVLVVIALASSFGGAAVATFSDELGITSGLLLELTDVEVVVGTGAPVQLGSTSKRASTCEVPDNASGCIRVGGSTVTATTGISFGPLANDCGGPRQIPIDVQRQWAISTAGTVTLDCVQAE